MGDEISNMSCVMRKPAFCLCENKGADQLLSNCAADQRLCFRFIDSKTLYLLNHKFQASSRLLWPYSPACVGSGRKPKDRFFHDTFHINDCLLIDTIVTIVTINKLLYHAGE